MKRFKFSLETLIYTFLEHPYTVTCVNDLIILPAEQKTPSPVVSSISLINKELTIESFQKNNDAGNDRRTKQCINSYLTFL